MLIFIICLLYNTKVLYYFSLCWMPFCLRLNSQDVRCCNGWLLRLMFLPYYFYFKLKRRFLMLENLVLLEVPDVIEPCLFWFMMLVNLILICGSWCYRTMFYVWFRCYRTYDCWFRCYRTYDYWWVLGGITMPDVVGIISDVILVIWPAPHARCVAAGTWQCSCWGMGHSLWSILLLWCF